MRVFNDSYKNIHLHKRQNYNKGGPHCELENQNLPMCVSEHFTEVEACQAGISGEARRIRSREMFQVSGDGRQSTLPFIIVPRSLRDSLSKSG